MTIYGASQSTGVERQLKIEKGIEGVILTVADHVGRKEQGRISVLGDHFVNAITADSGQATTVPVLPLPHSTSTQMEVEVRRNEVWLKMKSESGDGADIAVGFDDLQDALEGVISKS